MPSKTVAMSCVVLRPIASIAWLTTSFCIISWLTGTVAMRWASASTSASRASGGTALSTSPSFSASLPVILSPVKSMRFARSGPRR